VRRRRHHRLRTPWGYVGLAQVRCIPRELSGPACRAVSYRNVVAPVPDKHAHYLRGQTAVAGRGRRGMRPELRPGPTSALSARLGHIPARSRRAEHGLKTDPTRNSTFDQLCRSLAAIVDTFRHCESRTPPETPFYKARSLAQSRDAWRKPRPDLQPLHHPHCSMRNGHYPSQAEM
jgi:hypothetical protein